jgi:hypothetical protein
VKRNTRHHSRWRIDQDYRHKLSDDDRAWLDRFNGEYYRAEFDGAPLHGDGQRREIYSAQNAAARDVVTVPGEVVLDQVRRIEQVTRPNIRPRYYAPSDYAMFRRAQGVSEDQLILRLDMENVEIIGVVPARRAQSGHR